MCVKNYLFSYLFVLTSLLYVPGAVEMQSKFYKSNSDGDRKILKTNALISPHGGDSEQRKRYKVKPTKKNKEFINSSIANKSDVTATDCPVIGVAGGDGVKMVPFTLIHNQIHLRAMANGHSLTFILDTGSDDFLSAQAAVRAGIKVNQSSLVNGEKKIRHMAGHAKIRNFVLGDDVTLKNHKFSVYPLPSVLEKSHIDGIIGSTIFEDFVVSIDYVHRQLFLIQPSAFQTMCAGSPIALQFAYTAWHGTSARIPVIKASLDKLRGKFWIDTGSSLPVIVFSPFASRYSLYTRYDASSPVFSGQRVGGDLFARVAHGRELRVGSIVVSNPLLYLSTDTSGPFAFNEFSGDIGGGILKNFIVTFDYANSRMYLKPNR